MNDGIVSGQAIVLAFALVGRFAAAAEAAPAGVEDRTARPEHVVELETRVAQLEGLIGELVAEVGRLRQAVEAVPSAPMLAVSSDPAAPRGGEPKPTTGALEGAGMTPARIDGKGTEEQQSAPTAPETKLDTAERVPYGGYMELHLNHDEHAPSALDFHRFVLLFGHRFNDRIGFVGELELEHALVEGGEESGELELEQAYLDFLLSPSWSARAGMMLVPMGVVNERHEPASFHGVERPFVDTFIIPSTWFSNGAGAVGRIGRGFSLKAFLMSTLDGAEFSAAEGFRGGRQKGFFDDASSLAGALRLEYAGASGLVAGLSAWSGNTGFRFPQLSARADLVELDARGGVGRFDFRGELVFTHLEDSAELNRAIQRRVGVSPNVAERMRGYYLEGAFHVLPRFGRRNLVAFYRFEDFDTQYRMAPGFLPLEQFDRQAHTLGLTFLPHPDVALKMDYTVLDNESAVVEAPDRWNLGVGWWF